MERFVIVAVAAAATAVALVVSLPNVLPSADPASLVPQVNLQTPQDAEPAAEADVLARTVRARKDSGRKPSEGPRSKPSSASALTGARSSRGDGAAAGSDVFVDVSPRTRAPAGPQARSRPVRRASPQATPVRKPSRSAPPAAQPQPAVVDQEAQDPAEAAGLDSGEPEEATSDESEEAISAEPEVAGSADDTGADGP